LSPASPGDVKLTVMRGIKVIDHALYFFVDASSEKISRFLPPGCVSLCRLCSISLLLLPCEVFSLSAQIAFGALRLLL
jgi:hypothetical protein